MGQIAGRNIVGFGIGFALGSSRNGFTLDAGASGSRGKADGSDVA